MDQWRHANDLLLLVNDLLSGTLKFEREECVVAVGVAGSKSQVVLRLPLQHLAILSQLK